MNKKGNNKIIIYIFFAITKTNSYSLTRINIKASTKFFMVGGKKES